MKEYKPFAAPPKWFAAVPKIARPPKLPAWADPALLPPVVIGDNRLSDEQVTTLLHAVAASPVDKPYALIPAVKEHADPAALDAFAWKLFQLWQAEGFPSKEKWALGAVGMLGPCRPPSTRASPWRGGVSARPPRARRGPGCSYIKS